jgi:hypothetical protein
MSAKLFIHSSFIKERNMKHSLNYPANTPQAAIDIVEHFLSAAMGKQFFTDEINYSGKNSLDRYSWDDPTGAVTIIGARQAHREPYYLDVQFDVTAEGSDDPDMYVAGISVELDDQNQVIAHYTTLKPITVVHL